MALSLRHQPRSPRDPQWEAAAGHSRRGRERHPRRELKGVREDGRASSGADPSENPEQGRDGRTPPDSPRINQPGSPTGFRGAPRRVRAGRE